MVSSKAVSVLLVKPLVFICDLQNSGLISGLAPCVCNAPEPCGLFHRHAVTPITLGVCGGMYFEQADLASPPPHLHAEWKIVTSMVRNKAGEGINENQISLRCRRLICLRWLFTSFRSRRCQASSVHKWPSPGRTRWGCSRRVRSASPSGVEKH